MRKPFAALLLSLLCLFSQRLVSAVTINWSPVGNPGNVADQDYAGQGQFGAVGYAYKIGTYDVTNSQYVEFLNTKDTTGTNTLGLWNSNMAQVFTGGINFNAGNANGSKYTLILGAQNHPVNDATWYDAIRFANWLNNGQGNGDTETGAYTLGHLDANGVPINGGTITRNAGATVFLPSEDEWYKAAYYDPRTTAQGGPPGDSHYWAYPTSSNATPTASSPTALPNHANFIPGGPGNLTDVGAYTGTTSPYGAFDMGGNVFQWNEALTGGDARGLRGGSFGRQSFFLQASIRSGDTPTVGGNIIGFRVASTPEPATLTLLVSALLLIGGFRLLRWRRSHL